MRNVTDTTDNKPFTDDASPAPSIASADAVDLGCDDGFAPPNTEPARELEPCVFNVATQGPSELSIAARLDETDLVRTMAERAQPTSDQETREERALRDADLRTRFEYFNEKIPANHTLKDLADLAMWIDTSSAALDFSFIAEWLFTSLSKPEIVYIAERCPALRPLTEMKPPAECEVIDPAVVDSAGPSVAEDVTLDDTVGALRPARPTLSARHTHVYRNSGKHAPTHEVVLLTGHRRERALVHRLGWPWVEISLYPVPSDGYTDPDPNEAGRYPAPHDQGWLDSNEVADHAITAYERRLAAGGEAIDVREPEDEPYDD